MKVFRVVALIPVACLLCGIVLGSEPLNINEYAERSRQERPAAIAEAKRQFAQVRKSRRLKGAEKEAEIRRLEELVADLENPLQPYYASADFKVVDAAIGDMGWVREEVIAHEISGDTITVATKFGSSQSLVYNTTLRRYTTVSQSYPTEFLYIRGATLRGAKAGEPVRLDGLFVRTSDGIERLDLSGHVDRFTRKDEVRTWSSLSGHKTQAIFVRSERGAVTLMNLDGKTVEIELSNLSEDDRDYVRKFMSEQSRLAKRRK